MTPEEVFPRIFRAMIPIPNSPLKAVNSYVVDGKERFLIIDTGMNRDVCKKAMASYLGEVGVELRRSDFFITHFHSDHIGLVSELATSSSKIFFNHPDAAALRDPDNWKKIVAFALKNGFPESYAEAMFESHPGRKYQFRGSPEFTLLREGDEIHVGEYRFQCVETPGHTPGHLCLYEPGTKVLFSGDHLLESITPNITRWHEERDPLGEYLQSLDKLYGYDIALVLPGHREPFRDHRRRIDELKEHHRVRNEEILAILKEGKQSAYEVATRMQWDIDCDLWEDFPLPQKWFAVGEALSHLHHLEAGGRAAREWENGIAFYTISRETKCQ